MKNPQVVSMPSTVSDWLEEQLEAQGIDTVAYTNYIQSLLETNGENFISNGDLQFTHLKKNREIESLVNELCKKLKDINSEANVSTESTYSELQQVSQQELAEKYYAAFPPLCRKSTSSPPKFTIPKWVPSPKKTKRKQNRHNYENKLHSKIDSDAMKARNCGKQKYSYFSRNRKDYNICCGVSRSSELKENMNYYCASKNNSNNKSTKKSSPPKDHGKSRNTNIDQLIPNQNISLEDDDVYSDLDMKLYDDIPMDIIKNLLDSPCPQDETVEILNMANMRDNTKRCFIPCGLNIVSSIWSNEGSMEDVICDNNYNSNIDYKYVTSNQMLDHKFNSISICNDFSDEKWPELDMNYVSQNKTNIGYEKQRKSPIFQNFSLPSSCDDHCEEVNQENELLLNHLTVSLMKLNHCKETSSFAEITPKYHSKSINPLSQNSNLFCMNSHIGSCADKDKDDLLTSDRSHFCPITEKIENRTHGQYADGATFLISNNLDKVNYKRSESGSLYLENEFGNVKRYNEYRLQESLPIPLEFVLKFSICQNDKACQTEDIEQCEQAIEFSESNLPFGNESSQEKITNEEQASDNDTWSLKKSKDMILDDFHDATACACCPERPDSMVAEIMWKYESCEKCNNNTVNWNEDWIRKVQFSSEWDSQSLRNIWSGGEICHTCLTDNGGHPPPSMQNSQLREDISQDGDQLLSDIGNLQKSYMEESPLAEFTHGFSPDIMIPKEWKPQESFIRTHVEQSDLQNRRSWSFASRLEEDCLIQMSTIPTLRSVTL